MMWINKIFVFGLLMLLSSQSAAEHKFRHFNDWSKSEQYAYATMAAIAFIDVYQTKNALTHDCECFKEANPLFGSYPDYRTIKAVNLGMMALTYVFLGSRPELNKTEKKLLWGVAALRFGIVVNNEVQGAKFSISF